MENKVDIDTLLTQQDEEKALFAVTVERVADDEKCVMVTPFIDGKCMCSHSLIVFKEAIDYLVPTRERHFCCGKSLIVVNVRFAKIVPVRLHDFYGRLISAAAKTTSSEHRHSTQQNAYSPTPDGGPYYVLSAASGGWPLIGGCPGNQVMLNCGGVWQCAPPGSICCGTSHCLPGQRCVPIPGSPGAFQCI